MLNNSLLKPPIVFLDTVSVQTGVFEGLKKEQAHKEKACSAVFYLLGLVDPTISLQFPSSSILMKNHIISVMSTLKDRVSMSQEEELICQKAISVLSSGKKEEIMEENDFWEREEEF